MILLSIILLSMRCNTSIDASSQLQRLTVTCCAPVNILCITTPDNRFCNNMCYNKHVVYQQVLYSLLSRPSAAALCSTLAWECGRGIGEYLLQQARRVYRSMVPMRCHEKCAFPPSPPLSVGLRCYRKQDSRKCRTKPAANLEAHGQMYRLINGL